MVLMQPVTHLASSYGSPKRIFSFKVRFWTQGVCMARVCTSSVLRSSFHTQIESQQSLAIPLSPAAHTVTTNHTDLETAADSVPTDSFSSKLCKQ